MASPRNQDIVSSSSKETAICLTTLPADIHLQIFDLFKDYPEASACLGLTCKLFYPMFVARHKKAKLLRQCTQCGDGMNGSTNRPDNYFPETLMERRLITVADKLSELCSLPESSCDSEGHKKGFESLKLLLCRWMPDNMMYCSPPGMFVTLKRAREIQTQLPDEFQRNILELRINLAVLTRIKR